MLAVGVDAFPMVGIMALCTGFILAIQGLRSCIALAPPIS
jgi:ABC-type transporter Mla maintaining outer membrane lipid asymmetry permease subunit MlaE